MPGVRKILWNLVVRVAQCACCTAATCCDLLVAAWRPPRKGGRGLGGGGAICACLLRPSVRPCAHACQRARVRACLHVGPCMLACDCPRSCGVYVRPCDMSARPCTRACQRASVRTCLSVPMHACARACVRVCARACARLSAFVRRICAFLRACRCLWALLSLT